ncbi:FAD-binding oxidoreductase [Frigoribacterium sp. PhB24]|uniref:FAD-binding oxidoreductase n=1 Tax=Frigoribacterium sp. PhB24 TaxID=2485204 RepID=UPI000FBB7981|nr:FAD-binding oxidoreductase [Frigoribacterium sp. PhB24]ROS49477.1 ferredoxin-NADP reductase [Frigoribacterium sp. PhB24]
MTDGDVGLDSAGDPYAWLPAVVVSSVAQTSRARSLTLAVPGLRSARAGQHVDLRLTADDGYTAVRSYSLSDVRASNDAGSGGAGRVPRIEVTVERFDDGEVSPYLVDAAEPGDPIEVRGPIGGWFVWPPTEFEPDSAVHAVLPEPDGAAPPTSAPVQLIGGGSGVAPLMAMVRARGRDAPPMRLLASVRDPGSRWFVTELDEAARASSARAASGPHSAAGEGPGSFAVDWVHSREAPEGHARRAGRLTRDELGRLVLPASEHPLVYVCGANSFVAVVAGWMVELGHAPTRVRTERFGGV